jgi:hypothetical protein
MIGTGKSSNRRKFAAFFSAFLPRIGGLLAGLGANSVYFRGDTDGKG